MIPESPAIHITGPTNNPLTGQKIPWLDQQSITGPTTPFTGPSIHFTGPTNKLLGSSERQEVGKVISLESHTSYCLVFDISKVF